MESVIDWLIIQHWTSGACFSRRCTYFGLVRLTILGEYLDGPQKLTKLIFVAEEKIRVIMWNFREYTRNFRVLTRNFRE